MKILETWLVALLFLSSATRAQLAIKIGVIGFDSDDSSICFTRTAGAVPAALERVANDRILPDGTNFTILLKRGPASRQFAVGAALSLLREENVDVIVAPPILDSAVITAHTATSVDVPSLIWGKVFESDIVRPELFKTALSMMYTYANMGHALCEFMKYYNWYNFAFIYQNVDENGCFNFQRNIELATQTRNDCVISYVQQLNDVNDEILQQTLEQIRAKARIVLMCFDSRTERRQFALALHDANMISDDYVYIMADVDMSSSLFYNSHPFYIDTSNVSDGRDMDAKQMAIKSFNIRCHAFPNYKLSPNPDATLSEERAYISQLFYQKAQGWPFYCTDCTSDVSEYALLLYDVIYLYALALSKVVNESGVDPSIYRNGHRLSKYMFLEFEGLTGTVTVNQSGTRRATFGLYGYNETEIALATTLHASVELDNDLSTINANKLVSFKVYYDDAATTIWKNRAGIQPLNRPICGYLNTLCPVNIFDEYRGYFIAVFVIIGLLVSAIAFAVYYAIAMKRAELARQDLLWQVLYKTLRPLTNKSALVSSMRSLQSSTSSHFTMESAKSNRFFQVFYYKDEKVIGIMNGTEYPRLETKDHAELRGLIGLDNENVNKFLGLCIDGPEMITLWRFCGRGTLTDVIGTTSFTMDGFFIYSLIRDLAEGLKFIHKSFLGFHGHLKSSNCLVDDHWKVLISDYGLRDFRVVDSENFFEMLWSAPEVLRQEVPLGSKAADVYSFAIICSEIINMKPVWEPNEYNNDYEEIVHLVKKGTQPVVRPALEPASTDLSGALVHLVRDCWNESSADRPRIETVRTLLTSMNTGKNSNLMDHAFGQLEQYAGGLEAEVEQRTKLLLEEKKRSDLLLYRMLPKQVAEKLKAGQSVEPESFDCVTVFFSDVVSFTTLASRCTPLQVVTLLNDLYTLFDATIGEHDVYKVETIGDGYLCVSGLPHRNGNEHARHIADMSLGLIKGLRTFSVPHLPGERISLRIGVHTGGCVAGVVGLAMPRYCLFGDTINTASRMESNGKPNKIQLSSEANDFLTQKVGGFVTQSRGDVIIKGKGVMETFWLVGRENDRATLNDFYAHEEFEKKTVGAAIKKWREEEPKESVENHTLAAPSALVQI